MRSQMNGYIVADADAEIYRLYGYRVVSPADVRDAIQSNPEGETLVLEINSPGGDMFAGYEMYSVLKAADIPTEAEIQSLSASASSTAMLGVDVVKASPVAQVMIHLPSVNADGNASDHVRAAAALNSFKESILNAYELKSGGKKTRQELASMMAAETWLTVQDAMAAGLVDEVLYDDAGVIASQVVNSVATGIRTLAAAGGLPGAAELRERKAARDAVNGKVPPPAEPDKDRALDLLAAELELMKLR
ncbi:MAG TPA: head maturation protease, ClpP-related [Pseudoflavonifractor sp.]|nr:head maturation protease, ClpP-related [Pseudoflavonifractor sp.]